MGYINTTNNWYHKNKSSISSKLFTPHLKRALPLDLDKVIDKVITIHKNRCTLYHTANIIKNRQSKNKEFGFLLGMIFKEVKGKARSGEIRRLLKEKLENKA